MPRYKPLPRRIDMSRQLREQAENAMRKDLSRRSKTQLVELLMDLAKEHREAWKQLEAECQVATQLKSADMLSELARVAIDEATEDTGDFGGDYDKVQKLLEQLVRQGQRDSVLELGKSLYEQGCRQVEMSDEGLMCHDIDACLGIVFQALKTSSRTECEQMIWAWDLAGNDGYCVCTQTNKVFWSRNFSPDAWSDFADILVERVGHLDSSFAPRTTKRRRRDVSAWEGNSNYRYRREALVNKIQQALAAAGRAPDSVTLPPPV